MNAGGRRGGKKGAVNGKKQEESDIFKLVRMIMQRNFDPVREAARAMPEVFLVLLRWHGARSCACA